jgi:peptide/nickel transport system substrate-binding protein
VLGSIFAVRLFIHHRKTKGEDNKMKNKAPYLLMLMLLGLAVLLVACGGQPAAEPTNTPAAAATAQPASTPTVMAEATTEPMADFEPMVLSDDTCSSSTIKEVAAVDQYTVRFSMCNPDPAFLSKIAFTAFAVWPSEYLVATGGTAELLERPIGTGPYMLDRWSRGDSIIFRRNPDYWGPPANTETLVFRWATEGATRLLEIQAGTVDAIDNPSPDDFNTIRNDPNLQLIERPALNVFYLAMTNTFEPFNDVRVRQAVAMGIDRDRIVDNFYPAGSESASHFTPCSIPNGCAGDEWYAFDAQAARDLLAEAGYPDGFDTTIYYRDVFRGYLPEPGSVAQELQTQLRQNLGINATIEVMESGTFIAESTAGRLNGFYLLGWGADYPHITNFLDFHFSQANPQFGDPHSEIYELLVQGARIADPDESESIYAAANNAIRELVPMIPIAHGGSGVAYRATVQGGHASPLGNEYFAIMDPGKDTFVWMQNAEPISLYCGDETDGESLRACEQVMEALMSYEVGGTDVRPGLATGCEPNADLTVWTCTLRQGVKFHDGSSLDANDVVMSFTVGLDAASPLHVGNTGAFEYYSYLWGLMRE